jgi:SAM-dependent methyltransferase
MTRACGICGGPTALLYTGAGEPLTAAAFSPTCHQPGLHGDLFRCARCGTVQQPSLPAGAELVAVYRAMDDADYLAEEAGRRATARRLLELVERHAPRGRLLEVGCGHGLLLDEARRRGWDPLGLEPSAAAAGYARDVLGLAVRGSTLDQLDGEVDGRFEAIVMADVLEHLEDPRAAVRACAALLAPGGALCVVTPDPASRTARLAGRRWWGLLPAHTYLLPRRTLGELLRRAGLAPVADVGLRRTFSLGYWMRGLGERSPVLGAAVRRLRRLPPARRPVTLSLGDERVVVARKDDDPGGTRVVGAAA